MVKEALGPGDQDADCSDQEGQCNLDRIGEAASHGDNDGIFSAFVGVVGDPCVGMDGNTME